MIKKTLFIFLLVFSIDQAMAGAKAGMVVSLNIGLLASIIYVASKNNTYQDHEYNCEMPLPASFKKSNLLSKKNSTPYARNKNTTSYDYSFNTC